MLLELDLYRKCLYYDFQAIHSANDIFIGFSVGFAYKQLEIDNKVYSFCDGYFYSLYVLYIRNLIHTTKWL